MRYLIKVSFVFVVSLVAAQPQSAVTDVLASYVERTEQLSLYTDGSDVYSFGIGTDNDLLLEAFEVEDSISFGIDRIADRIVLRRRGTAGQSGGNGTDRNILFFEQDATYGGVNKNFSGGFFPTMEDALVCTCINRGSDNVFSNSGGTNINNIQRLDYIFEDGITVPANPREGGFPIFERGGNDDFKFAVINSLDASNDPATYGTVYSYSSSQWETTGYSITSSVLSGFPDDGQNLVETANLSSQQIQVIFISFEDLGFTGGETVYGYSLAGDNATTNSNNFVDFSDPTDFPNTPEADGGMDIMSGGAFTRKSFVHTSTGWYRGIDPNASTTTCDNPLTVGGGIANINSDKTFKSISTVNGSLNLNNNTVDVCEDINARFPFEINNGLIRMSGSQIQKITGRNLLSIDALEVDNSGNGLEVETDVDILDYLKLTDGDITTNDRLTFFCDFSGLNPKTAQIDDLGTNSIIGDVTTLQCYPGRRAFRFITPTATTTTNIRENWQEDASAWNDDPVPGYGTHITGLGVENATPTNDGQNGFDWQPSGNPSLFEYNNVAGTWSSIGNTNTNTLNAGDPYRIMIRGSRDVDIQFNASSTSNTRIRETGTITKGPVNYSNGSWPTADDRFIFLGNPFQAIVSMNDVYTASTNIRPQIYIWDPKLGGIANDGFLGGRGAFVTINATTGATTNSDSDANNYFMPKQAFFVVPNGSGAIDVEFQESFKNISQNQTTIFSIPEETKSLDIKLYDENSYILEATSKDAIRIEFSEGFVNEINLDDAFKLQNIDENLAILNDGSLLSMEERSLPTNEETLQLYVDQYRTTDYVFTINLEGFGTDMNVYLKDQYTDEQHQLEIGQQNEVYFNVDPSINASTAFNRFSIEFGEVGNLSAYEFDSTNTTSLYPNPVEGDYLFISFPSIPKNDIQIEIYNLLGSKVVEKIFKSPNSSKLKVENLNLNEGVYILEIKNDFEIKTQIKFIKS